MSWVVSLLCGLAMGGQEEGDDPLAVLRDARVVHGEADHAELRDSLYKAGDHERAQGRAADALALFEECLSMDRRLHPGDHEQIVSSLGRVALCHFRLARYSEALPFVEESLSMCRRLVEEDDAQVATLLNNLATLLSMGDREEEALPRFEESLAIYRRLLAAGEVDVAKVAGQAHALAICLRDLGRDAEALERYEEALAMWRRAFDGDHPKISEGMRRVALTLEDLDREAEALSLHETALAMNRRLTQGDSSDVARNLSELADCLRSLVRHADALPRYEESLAMRRRIEPADGAATARVLHELGQCLSSLGRQSEALERIEEALVARRRLYPGDHRDVAKNLAHRALLLSRLGREPEALPPSEAALAMTRRLYSGDHYRVADSLDSHGLCLGALGRWDDALLPLTESFEMRRRLWPDVRPATVSSLNNLGLCLAYLGRPEEALGRYREALAGARHVSGGDHPRVAATLNNMGHGLMLHERYAEARAILEESLAMSRRLYPGDHFAVALALMNVAACLTHEERVPEAIPLYRESVAIARRVDSARLHEPLVNLGRAYVKSGRYEEAVTTFAEVIGILETRRASSTSLDAMDRSRYFQRLRHSFNPYAKMVEAQRRLGRTAEALRYVEQGRARALLDLLERSRLDPLAEALRVAEQRGDESAAARLRAVADEVTATQADVSRRTFELASMESRVDLDEATRSARQHALVENRAEAVRDNRAAMRRRNRLLGDHLPLGRPAVLEELRRVPESGELMLVFSFDEKGGLLFLVPPPGDDDVAVYDLPIPVERLAERVDVLLDSWSRPDASPEARGLMVAPSESTGAKAETARSVALFTDLIPAPAWERIRRARRAYVAPHGALHRMPLEALVVRESDDGPVYWIDEGPPLSYAPSGTVWLECRRNRDARRDTEMPLDVLAMGDPVFDVDVGAEDAPAVPERGALVTSVNERSAAARAGLKPGDVLVSYDGHALDDDAALRTRIRAVADAIEDEARSADDRPSIGFVRAGSERSVEVAPGSLGVMVARGSAGEAWRLGLAPGASLKTVQRAGDLQRYGDLAPLPGTRREVAALFESFTGRRFDAADAANHAAARVLVGAGANEAELYRLAPKARVLHLATHYLVDETDAATRSMLALSLPRIPSEMDDGFLTVQELLERWRGRLDGCELVVLSACETARGAAQRDEGVFAMPWGLFYAGVPAVIVSHWRVDDESTATLMADFYRRLRADDEATKLEAFTAARRALRASNPSPYHWAPFVYLGDPR